jgi:hypothetical protein
VSFSTLLQLQKKCLPTLLPNFELVPTISFVGYHVISVTWRFRRITPLKLLADTFSHAEPATVTAVASSGINITIL